MINRMFCLKLNFHCRVLHKSAKSPHLALLLNIDYISCGHSNLLVTTNYFICVLQTNEQPSGEPVNTLI